ncbi:hypothetical protein WDZ17_08930 [Pseudokineococcus basanitobsidens]|uniref:Excreted virulence factor EspC (Type VII ESX diderm) n=1 Tax=Pseudokineococcus basanitobsidens TaxID=1926649 RepID=A0ABU8RJY2_9ACTN
MAGSGGAAGGGAAGAGPALAVDTAELARVRARLEQVAADLAAAGARMAAADGTALGARPLVTGLEQAQQDWGTHVRALRELADVAARDLGTAASGYDDCESTAAGRVRAADLAAPGTALEPGTAAATVLFPLPPPFPAPLPAPLPAPVPAAPVLRAGDPAAPSGQP